MEGKANGKLRGHMLAASEELHKADEPFRRASNIDFFLCLAAYIILALAIRLFIFEPVLVSGDSMYPTLLHGERMFVEKVTYLAQPPQRGDVIICRYPFYDENCVKRVIGLAGDQVSIVAGEVHINGQALDESAYWRDAVWQDMSPVVVPPEHVFVMGDNRNHSTDSRDLTVGPIPYSQIIGKAHSVIWPVGEARSIYTGMSPMAGVPYTPRQSHFLWAP